MLPTYEESQNIREVLAGIRTALPEASVLVVDDSSPDGTAELAEAFGAERGNVSVLRRPCKSGLGSAYREGFAWGMRNGFDVLVEMDADLSHDPAALPSLVEGLEAGADLVVGSRYVPGGSIPEWSLSRRLLSRAGNAYSAWMLGLGVSDLTSGYRAYRSSLLGRVDLASVRADGYGFQIEMVYRAVAEGGIVREVPIRFVDRTKGSSKMSGRTIVEALTLVTLWGARERLPTRSRPALRQGRQPAWSRRGPVRRPRSSRWAASGSSAPSADRQDPGAEVQSES